MTAPGPYQQIDPMDPQDYHFVAGDKAKFVVGVTLFFDHMAARIPQMNELYTWVNQTYQYKLDAESAAQLAAGDVFDDSIVSEIKSWSSNKIQGEINKKNTISVTGPTEIIVTTQGSYTINSPDSFTDYSVSVDAGTVSIDGHTITFTAPSAAGTAKLSITAGESTRVIDLTVLPDMPAAPVLNAVNSMYGRQTGSDTPAATNTAFSMINGSADTHESTDWEMWTGPAGTGTKVADSLGDMTNKTSFIFAGVSKVAGQDYYLRARFRSALGGVSDWGERVFSMDAQLVPTAPGTAYGGGFFVGNVIHSVSLKYALIAAPASTESTKNYGAGVFSYASLRTYDGYYNTYSVIPYSSSYPGAYYTRTLTVGGYSDWYLPSPLEMEIAYRNLNPAANAFETLYQDFYAENGLAIGQNPYSENGVPYSVMAPTQTTVLGFIQGATQAFKTNIRYMTSGARSAGTYFNMVDMNKGGISVATFNYAVTVRAFRRVRIA